MGKRQREELHSDEERNNTATLLSVAAERLYGMLVTLPPQLQLQLRRDLAIRTVEESVESLRTAAVALPEPPPIDELVEALGKAGDVIVVEALAASLSEACWPLSLHNDLVSASREGLKTLLPDGQAALLTALQDRGASFGKVLRTHLGNKVSQPLFKLGKQRTMWLLGASYCDPGVLRGQKALEVVQAKKSECAPTLTPQKTEDSGCDVNPGFVLSRGILRRARKRTRREREEARSHQRAAHDTMVRGLQKARDAGRTEMNEEDSDSELSKSKLKATHAFLSEFRKRRARQAAARAARGLPPLRAVSSESSSGES